MNPRPRTTISLRRDDLPAWLPVGAGLVYLDGERAAHLVGGRAKTLYVLPGEHWVGVGIGLSHPASLRVNLALGEHVDLSCGATHVKLADWSRRHWLVSVCAALSLLLTASLLALPFSMFMFFHDWTWFYRAVARLQQPFYWIVSHVRVLDPIISLVRSNNAYVTIAVIYFACTLGSVITAFFSVQFLRRRFGRTIYLRAINLPRTSHDPLALSAGEEMGVLTNACVLAAIKARDSRPLRTRSNPDEVESRPATVDDE